MAVPARRARELPPPGPKRRPRLASVPPRGQPVPRSRPRRARRVPFLLFSAAVVAVTLFLLAGAQALVSQDAFRVSALSVRAQRIQVENDLLRLEVAELSTPERIAAAGKRAGLVQAARVEVLDGADR
jgi:cell division protein FtsL